MRKSNDLIRGVVRHYGYIRFPDNTFLKNVKILEAKTRNAHMYWSYPYIIDIVYAKQWDEHYTIQSGKVAIPVTDHHTTKEYKFKYKSRKSLELQVREMMEWGVEVNNELKEMW